MKSRLIHPEQMRVAYLCLEQSRDGSAAAAHLRGFFEEWPVGAVRIVRATHKASDPAWIKLLSIGRALLQFLIALRWANIAGARAHPLVLPALVVARVARRRTFLFLQGRPSDLPETGLVYKALGGVSERNFRGAIRCVNVVFATSRGLAEWASSLGTAEVVQVTNGVDVNRFAWPASERDGAVFVGTPAPWQGLDVLLSAVEHPAWPKNVRLTIVGADRSGRPGPESEGVQFRGRLTPAQVADVLSRSNIGISPKQLDPATALGVSPFKLSEYHGAGLAVVASDVPGQTELVNASGAGILVKPDSAADLARAVRQIASEPELMLSMQKSARAYAEQHLSWPAQRAKLIDTLAHAP